MRSVAGSFKAAAVAYLVACDASAVAMLHRDSSLRSARIQHGAAQPLGRANTARASTARALARRPPWPRRSW